MSVESTDAFPKAAHRSGAGGANLSRVRAHNERLILSLLRAEPLPRAELARRTGLSAQTISLIVKALRDEGLLRSGDPIKGRVGQPSVPMALEPHGAWFAGLKIGRRSAELVLIDFTGEVAAARELVWRWPDPDAALAFVTREWPALTRDIPRSRLHGLGVVLPSDPWQWPDHLDAPPEVVERWRKHDLSAAFGALVGLPVHVENDATAACGAELTFGDGRDFDDFAYFFIGHFIGGGLVIDAAVHRGRGGNAGAFGSMPVPDPTRAGHQVQLIEAASLHVLEAMIAEESEGAARDPAIRRTDSTLWSRHADIVDRWERRAAAAIANAVASIASTVEIEAAVIDGALPGRVRRRLCGHVRDAVGAIDTRGIVTPAIVEGSIGAGARTLGAARLPLFARFLLDRAVLTRLPS